MQAEVVPFREASSRAWLSRSSDDVESLKGALLRFAVRAVKADRSVVSAGSG